jgi:hypothetical protein
MLISPAQHKLNQIKKSRWLFLPLSLFFSISCSSVKALPGVGGDEAAEEVAAEKPPTFVDFESLSFGIGGFPVGSYRPGQSITPHTRAYLLMLDIQSLLESRLGVSVESLKAALAANAAKVEDAESTWKWDSSFSFDCGDYAGSVTVATVEAIDQWSVILTRSPADDFGCCTDFPWFSGARSSLSEGSWTINNFRNPDEVEALAYVSWKITDLTHKQLEFYVKKVDPEFSEWSEEASIIMSIEDKLITIVASKNPLAELSNKIIWNDETGAGSIEDQDGNKQCWDGDQATVDCG